MVQPTRNGTFSVLDQWDDTIFLDYPITAVCQLYFSHIWSVFVSFRRWQLSIPRCLWLMVQPTSTAAFLRMRSPCFNASLTESFVAYFCHLGGMFCCIFVNNFVASFCSTTNQGDPGMILNGQDFWRGLGNERMNEQLDERTGKPTDWQTGLIDVQTNERYLPSDCLITMQSKDSFDNKTNPKWSSISIISLKQVERRSESPEQWQSWSEF